LNEDQIRKGAELITRYKFLKEDTAYLRAELRVCDYIIEENRQVHQNLLSQIDSYRDLDRLAKHEIEQWKLKYDLAKNQIKQERRRKRIYQVTTGVGVILVVFLAI